MFTIKQTVSPLLRAQAETKQRSKKLNKASVPLDRLIEWIGRYPQALEKLPKKDWIHTQDAKVQICIKMQSKEKLSKDLEKVMAAYENLISGIDSMHELHHIPSLGALSEEKTWFRWIKRFKHFYNLSDKPLLLLIL